MSQLRAVCVIDCVFAPAIECKRRSLVMKIEQNMEGEVRIKYYDVEELMYAKNSTSPPALT